MNDSNTSKGHDFDTSKLRGRMIEKFGSQTGFCEVTKHSTSFVSQYLNGKTDLDQNTIDKWVELLDVAVEDIPAFFFTKKVHETEQEG